MPIDKVKVVFAGRDAYTDSLFNIVKIGVYGMNQTDCIKALRDGIFDKYEREAPEFKCLSLDRIEEYEADGRRYTVFVFACVEYESDNIEVATLIAGKVTYSLIL